GAPTPDGRGRTTADARLGGGAAEGDGPLRRRRAVAESRRQSVQRRTAPVPVEVARRRALTVADGRTLPRRLLSPDGRRPFIAGLWRTTHAEPITLASSTRASAPMSIIASPW